MKKVILTCIFLISVLSLSAQQLKPVEVKGKVLDENGDPLIGAVIALRDKPGIGVAADVDGLFTLKATEGDVLKISMMGYKVYEYVAIKNVSDLIIKMEPESHELSEAVVTGMGTTQRKISIVGAVTTVDVDELQSPATSIPNMLGGRVAGIISRQNSGEPGESTAEFWVRGIGTFGAGQGALILIDGLEGSLNNIDPADIESFSVLKDASATAVYGVRGANGVVLVTTKRGKTDKLHITGRVNMTLSYLNRLPQYLGAYDYALLANEAKVVRGLDPLYSEEELYMIQHQLDPDLYPDVNWRDEIMKRTSWQKTYYVSARGGSELANYFVSLGLSDEDAAYKQDKSSAYKNKVGYKKYTYRTNVDMNLTKTTKMYFGVNGEYTRKSEPGNANTDELWYAQLRLTPLIMPTQFSNGFFPAAGAGSGEISPYVLLNHTGLNQREYSFTQVSLALEQDLSFMLKGLRIRGQIALDNTSDNTETRFVCPELWRATGRQTNGELAMVRVRERQTAKFSSTQGQRRKYHLESTLNYEHIFGEDHRFSALVYYYMSDEKEVKASETKSLEALPWRYQGLSSRLTYGFKDTYFLDVNFGYTGSANFKKGQRFGFFPSVAGGWIPTNYEVIRNGLPWLSFLKLRASYGLVGNDEITNKRFPYLTTINDDSGTGWGFNDKGIREEYIGADNLKWEKSKKTDIGVEGGLFDNRVEFVIDYFRDQRDGIFQERRVIPSYVGVVNTPFGNVGKMKSWGSDGNISYIHDFNKDMSLTVRANYTYSTNEVQNFEDSDKKYPYMKTVGWPTDPIRGYISLGLFRDEEDIANSPYQDTGAKVMPGDIKYKDVNGDGVVNDDDIVPLSYSNTPRLMYGLGLEFRYKKASISARFTGTGKTDFFYTANPPDKVQSWGLGYIPFERGQYGNVLALVKDPNSRWTPASYSGTKATENPNARFPRMSYDNNHNNNKVSSFWQGNAKYLRLSEVTFNYNLTHNAMKRVGVSSVDIQLTGYNLFVWDDVDLWDPELARYVGQAYPIPMRFAAQLYIHF